MRTESAVICSACGVLVNVRKAVATSPTGVSAGGNKVGSGVGDSMSVGRIVGVGMGVAVGDGVGFAVGDDVGDGLIVGDGEAVTVGGIVGFAVGEGDGLSVGRIVGVSAGVAVGDGDGLGAGVIVGAGDRISLRSLLLSSDSWISWVISTWQMTTVFWTIV